MSHPPSYSVKVALLVILLFGIFAANHRIFARPPKNEDEALQCMLYVTAFNSKNEELSYGSAFILEEAGVFWIYTNAHNLAGATRIEFRDHNGRKLEKFGRFACYSEGSGEIEATQEGSKEKHKIHFGGDGVKIELKESRVLGFELEKKQIGVGDEVITLGDKGGDQTMDILEGKISKATSKILLTTCKTAGGCSGGACVLKDSWRVIGLHTWGLPSSLKTMDLLWSSDDQTEEYAGASRLNAVTWEYMPAKDFMKGDQLKTEFISTIRMLSLIYLMTPTESGFVIDPDAKLAVDKKFGDAFNEYNNNQLLDPLIDLNDKLGRAKRSSIKVNSMEVVRTYYNSISKIRERYITQQKNIFESMPPYYRLELQKTGFHRLGNRIYNELEIAEEWFGEKAKVGGNVPVRAWFNLPRLAEF